MYLFSVSKFTKLIKPCIAARLDVAWLLLTVRIKGREHNQPTISTRTYLANLLMNKHYFLISS